MVISLTQSLIARVMKYVDSKSGYLRAATWSVRHWDTSVFSIYLLFTQKQKMCDVYRYLAPSV